MALDGLYFLTEHAMQSNAFTMHSTILDRTYNVITLKALQHLDFPSQGYEHGTSVKGEHMQWLWGNQKPCKVSDMYTLVDS